MKLLAVPSRRQNKNVLESKHQVLRDIFSRIKECNSQAVRTDQMLIQQVFRVSNNLHGNNLFSSYEIAKGYTLPTTGDRVLLKVPDELIKAHDELRMKRKLNLILRSKSVDLPAVSVGDLVDIFEKQSHQKRAIWIGPKKVLQVTACHLSWTTWQDCHSSI